MKVRTIVALATVSIVVAGCAKAATGPGSGSPSSVGIAHASGVGDLVIQISYEGGLVAPTYTLKQIPQFSLFGDGSVITPGAQIEIYPQPAMPSIGLQMVTEAGIQALLRSAIDAGLEDGASYTDFGSTMIADAPTTVFTFEADGVSHTVKVYALGMVPDRPEGMTADEFHARQALQGFLDGLGSLETWLPTGSVGSSEPFDGTGARLYVSDYQPDPQLEEPPMAWPLDPSLASFGTPTGVMESRCGVVTGQDWTDTLLPMIKGANDLTPWTSDGHRYGISIRPLLPNETAC